MASGRKKGKLTTEMEKREEGRGERREEEREKKMKKREKRRKSLFGFSKPEYIPFSDFETRFRFCVF